LSQLIAPIDILTSSGKYPDREASPECVAGVRINASDLAERVSKLLGSMGLPAPKISSGFRTKAANMALTNSAKDSAHMHGQAVDLEDPAGFLGRAILSRPDLLELFDLYLENPHFTHAWVHLQSRKTASGNRVFNP
jgi:hypothetical protein